LKQDLPAVFAKAIVSAVLADNRQPRALMPIISNG
jgi:hypothetical protein